MKVLLQPASVLLLPLLLWVAACSAVFSPAYDTELVRGLGEANEATLTMFSSLSRGGTQSNYSNYRKNYDEVIGKFDALRIRAEAREMPATPTRVVKKLRLSKGQCGDVSKCINPTPAILETLLSGLNRMRDKHQSSGLPADQVPLYKNGYEISITQALTVERAFER